MPLLNLGEGLSQMGQALSQTGGAMALEAQKANLESQKLLIANQLAEGSETRLAGVKAGYETQLESQKQGGALELAKTQSGLSVEAASKIQQNAADLSETLGHDPKYLAAQTALNSTDPAKMAQAAFQMQQAALLKLQTDTASKVAVARQAIMDEQSKPNPDQAKLAMLQQNFNTLLINPNARASLVTAMVGHERAAEEAAARQTVALNQAQAELQKTTADHDSPEYASLKANVDQLTTQVRVLNQQATDARSLATGYLSGRTGASPTTAPPEGTPDLGKYVRPGQAPGPVTPTLPTPGGGTAPAPGILNTPQQ